MRCQAANDQQLVACELPLQAQKPFLVARFDEFVNDCSGCGEAGFDAMLAGRQSEADGDVSFANAAGTQRDDILAAIDELRAGEI